MGWLMERVVKVDNIRVSLDCVNSTLIGTSDEPKQPRVFVLRKSIPYGLNEKPGFILIAEQQELIESGGSFRKVLKPVAWAYSDATEWTETRSDDWTSASFVLPLGNEYEQDEEDGQYYETGYWGIEFIPHYYRGKRITRKCTWISTGYNGEGYWGKFQSPIPMEWEDVVNLVMSKQGNNFKFKTEELTPLPSGDAKFLGTPAAKAA
jgi:hypothetical protein